jgi:broad specificity phosphatase PhoE
MDKHFGGHSERIAGERRRIYLARHARVDYFDPAGQPVNPFAVRLNGLGREQAAALGESLRGIRFDRTLCSRFPRARETLEIVLGTERRIAVEEVEAFNEIRGSRLRDIPTDRLEEVLRFPYRPAVDPEGAFLGGENFKSFESRVLLGLSALIEARDWKTIIIVAHDAVNRVVLGWALGVGRAAMAGLEQDYGCLNIIDVPNASESPTHLPVPGLVRVVNFTPYDPAKDRIRLTSMEEVFVSYSRKH